MNDNFLQIISKEMKRRKISWYRLSFDAGVHSGRLSAYKTGKSNLSEIHLFKVFKALGLVDRLKSS